MGIVGVGLDRFIPCLGQYCFADVGVLNFKVGGFRSKDPRLRILFAVPLQ